MAKVAPSPQFGSAVNAASGILDEIKAGGIQGALGIDQIKWNKGGAIYEVWILEPCCGQPWNPKDALECALTWYLLGPCACTRLYAHSLDQDYALVNHCLYPYCCPCPAALCMRYNLRKKSGTPGNILGDWVCMYCCMYCAACQEIRSVDRSAWTLWPLPKFAGAYTAPMKVIMV